MDMNETNKILDKLEDNGFKVTTPSVDGYGVEIISEEYFNEKVNEALEDN